MTEQIELNAQIRHDSGKQASRQLRRDKRIPAVIYGAKQDNVNITLDHGTVFSLFEEHEMGSQLFTVNIDGQKEQVVLKEVQYHPYKPKIMHLDLMRVQAEEPIDMTIPIHFEGEEKAPGVKEEGGIVSHLLDEVEIRCLPRNLPEYIIADLSHMQLNDTLHLSELPIPEGVELLTTMDAEEDLAVASINPPEAEETEEGGEEGELGEEGTQPGENEV